MENNVDFYIDREYDEDYFTLDVEKQYIGETNRMPYLKGDKDLSKHFKAWLSEKWRKDEINDVVLYRKQTNKIPYEKDNITLTKEFIEWYWNKQRKNNNNNKKFQLNHGKPTSVSYWIGIKKQ